MHGHDAYAWACKLGSGTTGKTTFFKDSSLTGPEGLARGGCATDAGCFVQPPYFHTTVFNHYFGYYYLEYYTYN